MAQKKPLTCLISYRHNLHDVPEDLDQVGSPSPLSRLCERLILRGIVPCHIDLYILESEARSFVGPLGRVRRVVTIPALKSKALVHEELGELLAKVDFVLRMDDPKKTRTKDPYLAHIRKELRLQLVSSASAKRKPELFMDEAGNLIFENGDPFLSQ